MLSIANKVTYLLAYNLISLQTPKSEEKKKKKKKKKKEKKDEDSD